MENPEKNKHLNLDKIEKRIRFRDIESDKEQAYVNLLNRINTYIPQISRRVSLYWKYLAIASSIALLLFIGTYIYTSFNKANEPVISYVEVNGIPGSKTKIILPDSSIVWLNADAKVIYPQNFTSKYREVKVRGEAFFEVKKDLKKPFIVDLDQIRIKVLGTKFNVWAESGNSTIETTLVEGSVALYNKSNQTEVADLVLKPNEKAVFYIENGKTLLDKVDASCYMSWVSGELNFKSMPFGEIVYHLEHAFNTQIHIQNKNLKGIKLNARFYNGETLDEILSILQIPMKYTYVKKKGQIYIM